MSKPFKSGGMVPKPQPRVVGEKGPELFPPLPSQISSCPRCNRERRANESLPHWLYHLKTCKAGGVA